MTKKIFLFLLPVLFTAQSCNLLSTSGSQGSGSAGVFLSVDSGDAWHPGKGKGTFVLGSANVANVFIQHEKTQNIVAASTNRGIIASDDYGENWVELLKEFSAYDVFINPFDDQEIFASGSKGKLAAIFKSPDRGSTWIQVYNEPSGESAVTALAVHPEDEKIMYAGLSSGTMLKSSDGGDTWHKFASFKDRVVEIGVTDTAVYVLNVKSGFSRSTDNGETWKTIKVDKTAKVNNILLVDPAADSTVYVGADSGLYRTDDSGDTWIKLPLPASLKVSNVTAVQLNPDKSGQIYAGIRSTVYRSDDDGATWRTVQLQTNRVISDFAIDPEEPNRIYAGFRSQ